MDKYVQLVWEKEHLQTTHANANFLTQTPENKLSPPNIHLYPLMCNRPTVFGHPEMGGGYLHLTFLTCPACPKPNETGWKQKKWVECVTENSKVYYTNKSVNMELEKLFCFRSYWLTQVVWLHLMIRKRGHRRDILFNFRFLSWTISDTMNFTKTHSMLKEIWTYVVKNGSVSLFLLL